MTTQFSLKKFLSFLFIIFLLTSCEKNPVCTEPPVDDPQPSGSLLQKVTLNDTDSLVFDYGSNGNLQKITSSEFEVSNGPLIFNFQYDASNRVKEIASNSDIRYKFVYDGNFLKLIENYIGIEKVSENHFVWAGNRIISNTVFTGSDLGNGNRTYRATYKATYEYDPAGWMKKLSTYTVNSSTLEATLVNQRVIEMVDNNYNPLSILEPINLVSFFEICMPRNILKEKLFNEHGQEEENTVNRFVLDSQKRVVSATSTVSEPGYTPTIISVKYFYR